MPEETLAVMPARRRVRLPSLYEGFRPPPLRSDGGGAGGDVERRRCRKSRGRGPARRSVRSWAIAGGIYRVLTDERLRRDMVRKGVARAGRFSWEQSVRRVHAIYDGSAPSRGAADRVNPTG
jgi:hypothetical protein